MFGGKHIFSTFIRALRSQFLGHLELVEHACMSGLGTFGRRRSRVVWLRGRYFPRFLFFSFSPTSVALHSMTWSQQSKPESQSIWHPRKGRMSHTSWTPFSSPARLDTGLPRGVEVSRTWNTTRSIGRRPGPIGRPASLGRHAYA
jgi:hypothetical protein